MYRWNELASTNFFHHGGTFQFASVPGFLNEFRDCFQEPEFDVIIYANPDMPGMPFSWPEDIRTATHCWGVKHQPGRPRHEIAINATGPGHSTYANRPRFVGMPPSNCSSMNPEPTDVTAAIASMLAAALNLADPWFGVAGQTKYLYDPEGCTRRMRFPYEYDLYCVGETMPNYLAVSQGRRARMTGNSFNYTTEWLELYTTGRVTLAASTISTPQINSLRPVLGLGAERRIVYADTTTPSPNYPTWLEGGGSPSNSTADIGFEQYHDHNSRRWTYLRSTSPLTDIGGYFRVMRREISATEQIGNQSTDTFVACLEEVQQQGPCEWWQMFHDVRTSYAPSTAYDQYSSTMMRTWTAQARLDNASDGRIHLAVIDSQNPSSSPDWSVLRYERVVHGEQPIYSRFGAQVACGPMASLGGYDCVLAYVPISGSSYTMRLYRFWYGRGSNSIAWDPAGPVSFGSAVMSTPAIWYSGDSLFVGYRAAFAGSISNGSMFRVRRIQSGSSFNTNYLNQNWSLVQDIPVVLDRLRAVQHRWLPQVVFSYDSNLSFTP